MRQDIGDGSFVVLNSTYLLKKKEKFCRETISLHTRRTFYEKNAYFIFEVLSYVMVRKINEIFLVVFCRGNSCKDCIADG